MVDDEAADHEPETAADRRERREQADAPGNAVARELVADDAEAEREDAAADALHDAAGNDDPERRPERRDDRARGERAAARSRAAGACRTCRRAVRRAACRPRQPAGSPSSPTRRRSRRCAAARASSGNAGISVVCPSANASAATPRIRSVRTVWGRGAWVVGIVSGGSRRENRSVTTPVTNRRRDVGVCRTVLAGWVTLSLPGQRLERTNAETTDREESACSIA